GHAVRIEPVTDLVQLLRVGALPPDLAEPVRLTRVDHQAVRESIHPQGERYRIGALAPDQAEDLETVLAPLRHVGGFDPQVSERSDAHQEPLPSRVVPSRNSMASRLNSSNFSSCAQCPQRPNTCRCARGMFLSGTSAPSSGFTRSS